MKTILIVDDKLSLTRMLQDYLSSEGYNTIVADNGCNALYTARHTKPDLILLDIMMPEMDGYEFMQVYRQEAEIPVIMLTAKEEKDSAIKGLELGADDYVTKPFDIDELSARIEAVMRRYEKGPQVVRILRLGELELDPEMHLFKKNGRAIELTTYEYALIKYLLEYPGRIFSRTELLDKLEVRGKQSGERTVDVHIRKLRIKIEDDPATPTYLETVFGRGYRLNRRINR